MKIREGNIYTKQSFLPTNPEVDKIRTKQKRLHRLFNPKRELPILGPTEDKDYKDSIRWFKRNNLVFGKKIVNHPTFKHYKQAS